MTLRRPNLLAYDWGLALLALVLTLLGLYNLRSAAPDPGLLPRQVAAFLLGLALGVGVQFLSRRTVFALAYPLYALSLALLVLVLLVGREINGARAWFVVGPLQFQPLEVAKLGLVLALARLLENRPVRRVWDYFLPGLLTLPWWPFSCSSPTWEAPWWSSLGPSRSFGSAACPEGTSWWAPWPWPYWCPPWSGRASSPTSGSGCSSSWTPTGTPWARGFR